MRAADGEWRWDSTLYAGAARHYVRGRVPYPASLIDLLVDELHVDGTTRLLDLGCGPGALTVPLASQVGEALGVDPDQDMLAEARLAAGRAGVTNARWVQAHAEEISPNWGPFEAITVAQAFHWMDRPRVASLLSSVLAEDGVLAFVHATTHQGVDDAGAGPGPRPPWPDIEDLIRAYLGPARRAGAGIRTGEVETEGERGRIEADIFHAAGFKGPVRRETPRWTVTRNIEDVLAAVLSLSYAAPHLFGDRLPEFVRDLRSLLDASTDDGTFTETMREIAVDLWRR